MSNEKKISLNPLEFEEAIADILKVKPPEKKPNMNQKASRRSLNGKRPMPKGRTRKGRTNKGR